MGGRVWAANARVHYVGTAWVASPALAVAAIGRRGLRSSWPPGRLVWQGKLITDVAGAEYFQSVYGQTIGRNLQDCIGTDLTGGTWVMPANIQGTLGSNNFVQIGYGRKLNGPLRFWYTPVDNVAGAAQVATWAPDPIVGRRYAVRISLFKNPDLWRFYIRDMTTDTVWSQDIARHFGASANRAIWLYETHDPGSVMGTTEGASNAATEQLWYRVDNHPGVDFIRTNMGACAYDENNYWFNPPYDCNVYSVSPYVGNAFEVETDSY
jgi:hypothetical protein